MTTTEHTWIGKDIKRREDPALLMGTAIYTNDMKLPGMLHAAVLRSPYAHGVIRHIDGAAARAMPGVLAVYTAADLATGGISVLPPRQVNVMCSFPVP